MRIILEVLRFMLLYFLLTTVIGGLIVILTDPILIQFGLDSENYIWMGIILAIPVILAIYKKKEWVMFLTEKYFGPLLQPLFFF